MTKIVDTIKALPNLLPLKGASEIEITNAELELQTAFSKDYKDYLSVYGAIMADGIELTGIAKSAHRNVVSVTLMERSLSDSAPKNMYVIENTGVDGIVIWQDRSGCIYQGSPSTQIRKIADSLHEYICMRK